MDATIQAVLAAVSAFIFITLLCAVVASLCKHSKKISDPPAISRAVSRPAPNRDLSSILIHQSASFDPSLEISMSELVRATKDFAVDGIIGDGSFGLVYKACLSNGVTVAVKKLSKDAFQGFREFQAEMETLGKLRHKNIVKILGYCVSGAERLLVYEFMERGSLDQWLYDTSPDGAPPSSSELTVRPPLTWNARTQIVRGVANGLKYLHGLNGPIIHRDIKASNILLDSEFEAHIADFGLARMVDASHSHVSTQFAGTMGYMPPEYKDGATVATVKADVYSFGILMMEVATGKRPNWPVKEEGSEVVLVQWARKMVAQNRQMEMMDPNLSREELKEAEVAEFFRIACLCASELWRDRPAISQVVDLLNQVWA